MRLSASRWKPIEKLLNKLIDSCARTPFKNNQSIIKIFMKKELLTAVKRKLRILLSFLLVKGVTKFSMASTSVDITKKLGENPGFLMKLYNILETNELNNIIEWEENGNFFIVKNLTEFTDKVLPKYFKHKNFASFVRQV